MKICITKKKNDMLKWMSSALLLLVPDKSNNVVLRKIAIPCQVSAADLCTQQESLRRGSHCPLYNFEKRF